MLKIDNAKYAVAFMLLVYEKPKKLARLIRNKTMSIGYVSTPKVPTIHPPTGKIFFRHAKMNASTKIVKKTPLTIFCLIEFTLFVVSKITPILQSKQANLHSRLQYRDQDR